MWQIYKVYRCGLRDTAREPQPPTNQPTGHQMSRQGLYVPKKAYFGAKMAVFGPNILIILGGAKVLVSNYQPPHSLFFFGRARDQMGKNPNCFGREQKFWYPHIGKPPRHLIRKVVLVGLATIWIRKF